MEVKCHDVSSIRNCLNLGQFWSHEWEPTSFLFQPKIISKINFFCSLFTRSNGISCPNNFWKKPEQLCNTEELSEPYITTPEAVWSNSHFSAMLYYDSSAIWSLTGLESQTMRILFTVPAKWWRWNSNASIDQFMFAKHTGEGK